MAAGWARSRLLQKHYRASTTRRRKAAPRCLVSHLPLIQAHSSAVPTAVQACPRTHAAHKGKIFMKLDFRQRLLATTLMVGAGMLATPAFAQEAPATDPAAQAP